MFKNENQNRRRKITKQPMFSVRGCNCPSSSCPWVCLPSGSWFCADQAVHRRCRLEQAQQKIRAETLSLHAVTWLVNSSDAKAFRPLVQGFLSTVPAAGHAGLCSGGTELGWLFVTVLALVSVQGIWVVWMRSGAASTLDCPFADRSSPLMWV